MTRAEAETYVRSCGESDGPDGDVGQLTELFAALYGREPDDDEWAAVVWSLCCAAVSDPQHHHPLSTDDSGVTGKVRP